MAREKEGYRYVLERVRAEAAGELVTVQEASRIVYGDTERKHIRKVTTFGQWIGEGRNKVIPATELARYLC